jgi:hypothetical protein
MLTPTGRSAAAGPATAAQRALAGSDPVLAHQGTSFSGRVFADVWSDGEVRIGTTDSNQLLPALIALQHATPQAQTAAHEAIAVAESPATGSHEAAYLGRAIVELWASGAVVHTSGNQQSAVLSAFREQLTSIISHS